MHPDVCRFISDEVYEGRLSAIPTCAPPDDGAGTGIRYLPVEHVGNALAAPRGGRARSAREIEPSCSGSR